MSRMQLSAEFNNRKCTKLSNRTNTFKLCIPMQWHKVVTCVQLPKDKYTLIEQSSTVVVMEQVYSSEP